MTRHAVPTGDQRSIPAASLLRLDRVASTSGRGSACLRTLAILLIGASQLHAGPPFITDDPVPVDYAHWEVYVAQMMARWSRMANGSAPQVEVNYGAVPNVQLHIIIPLAYSIQPGQPHRFGLGDTELGCKYRFVQETATRPQIAMFPLLELPTGNTSRGLGNGRPQLYLPLWAQKSAGQWTIDGGGGYWINPGEGNRNYWYTGAELQRQFTKVFMLGAEIYHATSSGDGKSGQSGFNVGSIYDENDHLHLMASVGRVFTGTPLMTSYAAIQLTF